MTRSAFIAMQDPYVGHHNGMDDDMVRVPAVGVLPLVSWLPHLKLAHYLRTSEDEG